MVEGKELIRLALFGQPVKTSLSPAIHGLFADQFDLRISYQLIETGAGTFPAELEKFRSSGGMGCNVTLPLKREAWRLAAVASDEVRLAEAANTLSYEASSGWVANTTDGVGLVTDMTVNHGLDLTGSRILFLGAGGATASVLGRVLTQSPAHVTLVNRNLERANALVNRFGSTRNLSVISWDELPSYSGFDLVINSTSLGHQGKAPSLLSTLFAPGAVCYDLNYYKASLPLKQLCSEMGQTYIDGLGMLVEQAAASFYIWTGKKAQSRIVIEKYRDKNSKEQL